MFPESIKFATWNTRFLLQVDGFQIQMFPESIKYATRNIVTSYAVLGSGKLVFKFKCSLESIKYATGNIVVFLKRGSWTW